MLTISGLFYVLLSLGGTALAGFYAGYMWGRADERRRLHWKHYYLVLGVSPEVIKQIVKSRNASAAADGKEGN